MVHDLDPKSVGDICSQRTGATAFVNILEKIISVGLYRIRLGDLDLRPTDSVLFSNNKKP